MSALSCVSGPYGFVRRSLEKENRTAICACSWTDDEIDLLCVDGGQKSFVLDSLLAITTTVIHTIATVWYVLEHNASFKIRNIGRTQTK